MDKALRVKLKKEDLESSSPSSVLSSSSLTLQGNAKDLNGKNSIWSMFYMYVCMYLYIYLHIYIFSKIQHLSLHSRAENVTPMPPNVVFWNC